MITPGSSNPLLFSADDQYKIARSLRFNSADSAYLSRTPSSSPTSNQKFTLSCWFKRTATGGTYPTIYSANDSQGVGAYSCLVFSSDAIYIQLDVNGSAKEWITSQVFRDLSAWYHIVWAVDTTQATATDRMKLYVNGSLVTAYGTQSTVTQNGTFSINTTTAQQIGNFVDYSRYIDGYLTEFYMIDGQQLAASSFGETDAATGVWKPKKYTGTYGTNGFYLNFSDNSGTTSTTLGKDSSGNANNWTPNNFSVTAGAGNDSLVDTPTAYGSDTGAGGEVRGNYATLNPLRNGATLVNGNLDVSSTVNGVNTFATFGVSSGKWYFETNITTVAGTYYPSCGVNTNLALPVSGAGNQSGEEAAGYMYLANGTKYNSNTASAYGSSVTSGDVVGVALDMDAGKIWFSKNGTFQNSGSPTGGTNAAFSGITGTAVPVILSTNGSACTVNFGQRPFAYTAPSGFKALCTQNLPTPTIGATSTTQAGKYFNTVTYTGTGSSLGVTGVGFQPDLVWIKGRSGATDHGLYDAVRGVQKQLESNTTDAETTETTGLTAFGTDGFTVGALAQLNTSTATYVGWNWKGNGSGSSNTSGTITSTVSANTTAGFSIVTYTGTGANATVGHGLGVAPSFYIVKCRSSTTNNYGMVYHASLGGTKALYLQLTNAVDTASNYWQDTAPTSSVFSIGTYSGVNASSATYVAYCFAPVAGYSAFGSYTGNGSTDGPFIFTGFRPRYVMVKRTDAANSWMILDTARTTTNAMGEYLYAEQSAAGSYYAESDFLSNGFKLRVSSSAMNANGGTYIYAAFAESPFKYSLAR